MEEKLIVEKIVEENIEPITEAASPSPLPITVVAGVAKPEESLAMTMEYILSADQSGPNVIVEPLPDDDLSSILLGGGTTGWDESQLELLHSLLDTL